MKDVFFNRSSGEVVHNYKIIKDFGVGGGGILGDNGKAVSMELLKPRVGDIVQGDEIRDLNLGPKPIRGIEYWLKTSMDKTKIIIPESSLEEITGDVDPGKIAEQVIPVIAEVPEDIKDGDSAIAEFIKPYLLTITTIKGEEFSHQFNTGDKVLVMPHMGAMVIKKDTVPNISIDVIIPPGYAEFDYDPEKIESFGEEGYIENTSKDTKVAEADPNKLNKNIIIGSVISGAMAGLIIAFMLKKETKQYVLFALGGALVSGLFGAYITYKMNKI